MQCGNGSTICFSQESSELVLGNNRLVPQELVVLKFPPLCAQGGSLVTRSRIEQYLLRSLLATANLQLDCNCIIE